METLKNNKMIAQFMEYQEGFPNETDEYGYIQCVEGYHIPNIVNYQRHKDDRTVHEFSLLQLRFHLSFDWLMSVVDKINTMDFDNIGEVGIVIYPDRADVVTSGDDILIEGWSKESLFLGVYETVVRFIEWYNKVSPEKK